MHLGIFTKIFVRPTLEGALDAVAAHGLRWMQFNFACAGLPNLPDEQIAPALLDNLRQQLDARGLSVAAVSGTFNMAHPDPRQRREGLRRLLVNACYWGVGMEEQIPAKSKVDLVGDYQTRPFASNKFAPGVKPSDLAIKRWFLQKSSR